MLGAAVTSLHFGPMSSSGVQAIFVVIIGAAVTSAAVTNAVTTSAAVASVLGAAVTHQTATI